MKKEDFIKNFSKDKVLGSVIFDKIKIAKKSGKVIYSNEFYSPDVWKLVSDNSNEFELNIYSFGVFEEAERRMLCFSNDTLSEFCYPLRIVKISNKSKFHELKHKDYLGAVMSLGFKREKLGDFVVSDNCCFLPASTDICSFICDNLNKIGNCPCNVEIMDSSEDIEVNQSFKKLNIISASLRLDCVICKMCNISRSKGENLIEEGKVLIDYFPEESKDKLVDAQSVITIRGYGKFKIVQINGVTKKGKYSVEIEKYI